MWCCGQQPFLKRLSTTKLFGTITGAQANSIIEVDVGKNVLLSDFALSIVTPDGGNSEKTIEPLVDTQLELNYGTKYWPIGPNGIGKSTLLQALADGLVEGLPQALKILYVNQMDTSSISDDSMVKTVLQTVLDADTRVSNVRSKLAIQQRATVVEHSDSFSFASHKAMLLHALLQVKVIEAKGELAAATKIAIKRSGMRGKYARRRQLEVERVVTDLELQLQFTGQMNNERETVRATNEASILARLTRRSKPRLTERWLQVRILLAPVLFMEPDMLLLDEQTNHVTCRHLVAKELPTIHGEGARPHFDDLLVSHDKFFLNEIAEETILGRGQDKKLVYFDGNYDSFEEAMDRRSSSTSDCSTTSTRRPRK
ncbi:P-loop containing nucleoside triphosphate hydrolase [Phytophthora cactorum]|nr:P-loop containing nucleoside triphosphate hydrolase [Phytophthora cactorum]